MCNILNIMYYIINVIILLLQNATWHNNFLRDQESSILSYYWQGDIFPQGLMNPTIEQVVLSLFPLFSDSTSKKQCWAFVPLQWQEDLMSRLSYSSETPVDLLCSVDQTSPPHHDPDGSPSPRWLCLWDTLQAAAAVVVVVAATGMLGLWVGTGPSQTRTLFTWRNSYWSAATWLLVFPGGPRSCAPRWLSGPSSHCRSEPIRWSSSERYMLHDCSQ